MGCKVRNAYGKDGKRNEIPFVWDNACEGVKILVSMEGKSF